MFHCECCIIFLIQLWVSRNWQNAAICLKLWITHSILKKASNTHCDLKLHTFPFTICLSDSSVSFFTWNIHLHRCPNSCNGMNIFFVPHTHTHRLHLDIKFSSYLGKEKASKSSNWMVLPPRNSWTLFFFFHIALVVIEDVGWVMRSRGYDFL